MFVVLLQKRGGRGEKVLTTVQDVVNEMASIADSNIDDPNSMRANDGKSWVFSHFPKFSQGNTLPRIGFHSVDETHPQVTLGSTRSRVDADIQSTIVVRRGKKYDYDGDGTSEQEEELVHYLKDQVKQVVESNQSQLTGLEDVAYVIPTSSTVRKPENKNIIFLALTFEARIDNC